LLVNFCQHRRPTYIAHGSLPVTTLVRNGEEAFAMGRADEAGAGSYALPQRQASFRFRDDTASLLRRARRAVAEWHKEQPRGSAEELVAGIGGDFPEVYYPVLRARLAVLQDEAGSPRLRVPGSGAEVTARGAVELGDDIWRGERFEASIVFPGLPEHVRTARKFVSRVLDQSYPCRELAVQLVSELVTNSVQHSDSAGPEGAIGVTVSGTMTDVTVEVADAGGEQAPQVRPGEDLDAEGGRGLQLVAALASEWGFQENAAGRVAWFTISGAAGRTAPAPGCPVPGVSPS
jgi:anti-sigma regulatory factor (Ser/Thr protein kinase)